MKKLLLFLSFFFFTLPVFFAPSVFAESPIPIQVCPTGSEFDELCTYTGENVGGIVNFAVNVLLVIAVVIALIFLIWGGIKWILSGGDKGGVEAARNMIVAAIVGLLLAFLAFFVLNVVLQFFDIDLNELKLPSISGALGKDNGGGDLVPPDLCPPGESC
ncbi:MAG TPA: pilin [Patescibacteria group bacterium]|nr:pilin [Patescibacteria group bacterium]